MGDHLGRRRVSLGTYAGGWRIIRTLGRRIVDLDPPRGFAAETTAASGAVRHRVRLRGPVSTTHTIRSAILGVGATRRLSAVRWGVGLNIVTAWVFTIPGAGLVAARGVLGPQGPAQAAMSPSEVAPLGNVPSVDDEEES